LNNLSHNYKSNGKFKTWEYKLLECKACGLGFIAPKPDRDLLQTFYAPGYGCYNYSANNPKKVANSFKYRLAQIRYAATFSNKPIALLKTIIGVIAEWIIGKTITYSLGIPLSLPKDAHIFEIGYGSGEWILAMKMNGYCNLYGYDIDANYGIKSRLLDAGIILTSGLFLDNDYPQGSFDCIRLEHAFEHLLEPLQVLKKCFKMLKPGGHLVMNFPCKNSVSFQISPLHYAHLDIPRHLYHHTEKSALNFLKNSGFTVKSLKVYPVSLVLASSLNNMLKHKNMQVPVKLFALFAPAYMLLNSIIGKGENITVFAQR